MLEVDAEERLQLKKSGQTFLGILNDIKRRPEDAAEVILSDRKHLDYNPHPVYKNDIIDLLKKINSTDV